MHRQSHFQSLFERFVQHFAASRSILRHRPGMATACVLGMLMLPLSLAPSCKTQADTAEDWPSEDQKVLELRRTPCFGKCPVDHLILYADGTLRYVGTQNVEQLGLFRGQLPQGRWDGILDQADKMGFWTLEERYPTGDNRIMDLPSEQLWFRVGENEKRVINQRYANPDVEGEQQIVEQLNSLSASIVRLLEEAELTFIQGPPGGME
jgi:hypothetical protein